MSVIKDATALIQTAFTKERQHEPITRAELDLVRAWVNLAVATVEQQMAGIRMLNADGEEDAEQTARVLAVVHLPVVIATRLMATLESLGFVNDVTP